MRRYDRSLTALLICFALFARALAVRAFETNQYDLSPVPLADIGNEVSDYLQQKLREAVDNLNAQIAESEACLQPAAGAKSKACNAKKAAAQLTYLRSDEAVARATYDLLGAGTAPFSKIESWVENHKFQGRPARYKVGFWKSLFLFWPVNYVAISPTVSLYGSEFGTDKFGHMFQQGYDYYKIYNRARDQGASPAEARSKAVQWGQRTEETKFGTLVTGVYSNGDLFGNYAGLKFYQGLTQAIRIGDDIRPPIFVLRNGFWAVNENFDMRSSVLKPLISDHLNEALNPSIFTQMLGLRWYVRRKVANRGCARWFDRYPDLSREWLEQKSGALTLWHGEDYGFTDSDRFITIANTCFKELSNVPSDR